MKSKLVEQFKFALTMTSDKNHAAACAIFETIFQGDLNKWNARQDEKWTKKYNKGLIILADAGLITLCAR